MGPPAEGRPGPVTQAERDFNRLSTEYYWGSVWNRPGLELAERSICTLACLTVLGREGPLRSHISGRLPHRADARGNRGGVHTRLLLRRHPFHPRRH